MDKIYVKIKKIRGEKPEDFFDRLYKDDYGFPFTYHDKDCTQIQCNGGAARSFSDLYKLMRTYYTKITQSHLMKIIIGKCTDNEYYNLIYCPNICKIVLYTGKWHINEEDKINRFLFNNTYFDYCRCIYENKIEEIDEFTIYYLYGKLGYTKEEIKQQIEQLKIKDD